jgi:netrin 1
MPLINSFYLLWCLSSVCAANRWYRMFYSNHDDPCVDRHHRYQRCIPDFVNAAFQKSISASSTCGNPAQEFCSSKNACHLCDTSQARTSYPIDYLTDLNNPNNFTCWQSDRLRAGENVSLTLSLNKKFEITYISVQFCSNHKPDSMAIFKSMDMVRDLQRASKAHPASF